MEENHERKSRCWFRGLVRGRTVVGLLVMGFAGKSKSKRGFWLLFWSDGVGKEVVLIVPAAIWELVSGGWRSSGGYECCASSELAVP
ncbi:hypothetical protein KY285_016773 [Solanum tuberosum]|nr:hypothetical protein KY285_016773 [Solanum tuberosum]